MVLPVSPLLQVKVLLPVPPVAEALIEPLLPPAQETFVTVPFTVIAFGDVTVKLDDAEHPLASLTVTVYAPLARLEILAEVEPLLHEYVLLPVPPLTLVVMLPLEDAAQSAFVTVPVIEIAGALVNAVLACAEQP
jgi:hypothetical protein